MRGLHTSKKVCPAYRIRPNLKLGRNVRRNLRPRTFMNSHKARPDIVVKQVQNYEMRNARVVPHTNVPSLKWGLKFESTARKEYNSLMKPQHHNFLLSTSGLCICLTEPFLRASPDAIVSCTCHPKRRLLEIKCPYSAPNTDPSSA